MLAYSLTLGQVAAGLITGLVYGLLAAGLVLVFRSSRFINFAHGEIGVFSAGVFALLVVQFDVPYLVAFPIALLLGAGLGAGTEAIVVRRLANAPRLMSMVATLGLGRFLVLLGLAVNAAATSGNNYPNPPGLPTTKIGQFTLTPAHWGILVFAPAVMAGLIVFLRRSRYGLAIQGAAANPDAAVMAGFSPTRMSTLAWGIAGALSAFTAMLLIPTQGLVIGEALGPSILVRALAAAVVGRMTNLGTAFGAGVAIGLGQAVIQTQYSGTVVDALLFVALLGVLIAQRPTGERDTEKGSWTSVAPWPALPESMAALRSIRLLPWVLAGAAIVIGLALPSMVNNEQAFTIVKIVAFALVGLSLSIITGLGGQLSLGQIGVASAAAVVSFQFTVRYGNFPVGFALAAATGAALSVLLGLPALRVRGLLLAVSTLGFALASGWVLSQSWAFGKSPSPGRPIVGDFLFDTDKRYAYVAVPVLVLGFWLAGNLRKGAFGRQLIAVRDNEAAARAFAIGATRVKLQAYALSGVLAGLGGALYGHLQTTVSPLTFAVKDSIDLVAMAVIGGIAVLAGPLLGAIVLIGVPGFIDLDPIGQALLPLSWLLLILYYPNGLAGVLRPLRDAVTDALARRAGVDPVAARQPAPPARVGALLPARDDGPPAGPPATAPLLELQGLIKRYGGVTSVNDVSLTLRRGETLGLIGPNGAGKTTLFELISGFVTPDEGKVLFAGTDVTSMSPDGRARLGLIRSFQDAALFPTMTALDVVRLSQERLARSRLVDSVVGRGGPDRAKDARARELLSLLGLDAMRDKAIGQLSTGTRRIVEICCLLALEPTLLLLDEPAAGVAQRETEALGGLLAQMRTYLDTTLVVIEHDMPMLTGLCDRFVALESGSILAQGDPLAVQNDPAVQEAFLGGDPTAVNRSGTLTAG